MGAKDAPEGIPDHTLVSEQKVSTDLVFKWPYMIRLVCCTSVVPSSCSCGLRLLFSRRAVDMLHFAANASAYVRMHHNLPRILIAGRHKTHGHPLSAIPLFCGSVRKSLFS